MEVNINSGYNYNIEAEKYVIGCILMDSQVVVEVLNRVTFDDFYDPKHKNIMKAVSNLYGRNEIVDYAKVYDELGRMKQVEASGGIEYLSEIIDSVPSVANVTSYVEIIEEKSLLRDLMNVCEKVKKDIIAGQGRFNEISDKAERDINGVIEKRKTSHVKKIDRFTDKVIELAESSKGENFLQGLDTGFAKLNKATSGFQKGELIILAARPGIGKSALAMNIATNACRISGASVAFFSLEMSNEQLVSRILSSCSGISYSKIKNGEVQGKDMQTLIGTQALVNKFNLYLDEECNTNLSDIRAKCLKLKRENKLDLIVIDYLQLVMDTQYNKGVAVVGNRQEEVSRISRGLKKMARDFNVPVIALSQLSRLAEQKDTKEPSLAHLRESGSIEQDADVVLFLNRPGAKDGETKAVRSHKTELIIAKNRQGAQTKFGLYFKGPTFTFIEDESETESLE